MKSIMYKTKKIITIMKKKQFVTPSIKVCEVEMTDIIATSGAGGTVPDAPFHSRRMSDWDDED